MTKEVAKKIVRGITDKIECNTVDIDDWAEFWGFTREEYEEFLDMAIKALESQRWIPVSERLPEDGQDVLICDIDGDIMIGYHVRGRLDTTHFSQQGSYEHIKNVKAWMPLPEPYKAESEERNDE